MKYKQTRNEIQANQKPWEWTSLMSISDKLQLRIRAIIETINDELKNMVQVEHSRHRCFDNLIVNLLGALATYGMFPKKPCTNVQRTIDTLLSLF